MIVNSSNLRDLFTAYNAAFRQGFGVAPNDYEQVSMTVPSTTTEEHYAWLGQFPKLREWIGDRVINQMRVYDYRIKNKKFESSIGVKRDEIKDDRYGVYTPLFTNMGEAARAHPNEIVFPMLPAGFSSPCYDGQYFFDSDHPVGREGAVASVSNVQAGSSTPWYLLDLSRSLRPLIFQKREDYLFRSVIDLNDSNVFSTDEFWFGVDARVNGGYGLWQMAFASQADLTTDNFNAAYQAMQSFMSDEGRPLGMRATHLVVPPTLRAAAKQIVRQKDQYGGDNVNADIVKVLDTPWLA